VEGDATRLAQVLVNLLNNAVKFTDRGGAVTVQVQVEEDLATISVRDTGIGIEPEMLLRVFDTFAQADRTLNRSSGGLGLGLALVRGLVELHHGTVYCHSKGPGCGAEFTFLLPRRVEAGCRSARPEEAGCSAAVVTEEAARRILVVEDNADVAESLRDLLELFGCMVEVAYSGPAGVEAARQFRPHVVLCDIGLPGMDGYAVAAVLRRDAATASARLLAVSGYGQEEDQRRSREAGFDEHLTKPVDLAELERALAASLSGS
jgi:CheY-like chemotaxis protein